MWKSSRGSFLFLSGSAIVHFTAFIVIDIHAIFTRQPNEFIFHCYLFGHHIWKVPPATPPPVLPEIYVDIIVHGTYLTLRFPYVKKRYKTQRRAGRVWKFYSRCLYCATSPVLFCSSICAKARPTCTVPFFTRKTPLRRNSARWITLPLS